MKVHCNYCKFNYYLDFGVFGGSYLCKEKAFYSSDPMSISKDYPYSREKNKDMDCKYFKPSLCTRLFRRKYLKRLRKSMEVLK